MRWNGAAAKPPRRPCRTNCFGRSALLLAHQMNAFRKSKNIATRVALTSCSKYGEMIGLDKRNFLGMRCCLILRRSLNHRGHGGNLLSPAFLPLWPLWLWVYLPMTSFAIVANCMLEVPS